jgi:DNA-binding beta-propeller fold protein YncE
MRHALAVLLIAGAVAFGTLRAQEGPYRFVTAIPIGGEGGWDYLTVDAQAHRLYVSHATKIVVVDTESNKVVGEIADTPGVHGIALAPELGRGFTSNGRENKVSIVDLKTLKTIQKVATGENPDAILYEPARKEVYAFNGRGKSATVIDADKGTVIATIPLGGKPEFAQADSKAGKVFVNMEDLNSIKVIDTAKHTVAATWPIAPGEAASGMAIDLANQRLFIGCENRLMLMIDNTTGSVVYSVPIGEGVDANAFDPATRLAFASSGGSATVTVARADSPALLKVVQTLKTVKGARTMTLDPVTHRIYLAANVSGTFSVQVYEMVKGS